MEALGGVDKQHSCSIVRDVMTADVEWVCLTDSCVTAAKKMRNVRVLCGLIDYSNNS